MKRILLPLFLFAGLCVAQTSVTTRQLILPLQQPVNPVSKVTVQVNGNPGPATYYYWVVARYVIGNATPAGPFVVTFAPNTISSGSSITVSWTAATGAASYDVLRTSTPMAPSGACGCAVATAVTGTSTTDTSATTSAYTVATFDSGTVDASIINAVQGAGSAWPQLSIGLTAKGFVPAVAGAPTTGHCVDWASATTLGDAGAGCGSGAGSVPVVYPETYGAKGDGGFYYDGSITPPSMPANTATGSTTTPITPTITTPAANSLVIFAGLGNAAWSANMTGTNQVNQTFSAGNYALNVSTETVATAQAVSGTGTLASSTAWAASAVALGPASGSTIAQVGTWTSVQTPSTTTITVSVPTGVQSGDMLVAVIDWYSHTMTPPAGWVQLTTATDGGGDIQAVYYYVAGATTPSSFTWTQTGTSGMSGAMGAYGGVNTESTLTSATAAFSAASVNDAVCTAATGANGVQQCGTIKAYNSATSVDVSYIASASASSLWFTYGTDDTAAFTTMLGSAPCSTVGCRVQLQPHEYMLTAAFTLPPDRTVQIAGAGYGLGNTENSYLNGNTLPNANMGSRLDWATTALTGPALTIGGTAGVTSTAAFDLIEDVTLYGGAGHGRDGGGGAGVAVENWQGFEGERFAVVNFAGAGFYVDGVTSSSYKDYIEQIVLDGYYGLWNGGAGYQLGSTGLFINNIETDSLTNSVLENNGGPGIWLAGKAIQGFTAYNDVIQWNNTASANPELTINWATGANAPQACLIESNYFEVDTNGGSHSSAWITPNATGCAVLNNFLAGDAKTGRTALNTTTPLTAFQVNGSAAVGFDNTSTASYDVLEKATAALTADQLVCLDASNPDSVVACGTTTTAQMVGFADGAISASAIGPIRVAGKANPTSSTTCAIGNYVTASSTTAGDVACTATLPAQGLMAGFAETALGTAPGAITVLIDKR